jgi:hypothetical protein
MLAANPAKPGFSEDSFNQASAIGDQSKTTINVVVPRRMLGITRRGSP